MRRRHDYYLDLAEAVRAGGTCLKKQIGAVLVMDDRILSTGYNGTAAGLPNCNEGGCARCADPNERYTSGHHYDLCVCVHAESNALLNAARFGIAVQGAVLYSTVQPCFTCAKQLIQAGIAKAFYREDWIDQGYEQDVRADFIYLQGALKAVKVERPERTETPDKSGRHTGRRALNPDAAPLRSASFDDATA
jgi:dCMP deaminase